MDVLLTRETLKRSHTLSEERAYGDLLSFFFVPRRQFECVYVSVHVCVCVSDSIEACSPAAQHRVMERDGASRNGVMMI